jgi:chromosomal replication initiation ATPase DnaA
MTKQLLLPFGLTQGYAKEDFCPAPSNAVAREWLARPERWSNNRLILWGDAGCGKTHLLRIWVAAQGAALFDGANLGEPPGRVDRPVAVDDSDIVEESRALLHLLNSAAEAGQPVLLTARHPPARQAQKLADLASRLRASTAVEIRPPEDELLDRLLMRLAAERQLLLSPGVKNFILTRLARTPAVLREAVARLDRAALDRHSRITRTLAADILADLAGFDTDAQVLSNRHSRDDEGLL